MISITEQQAARELISDASISVKDINVGGNVQGHITVGNENVVGNDNIVLNVHDSHGAIVNVTKDALVVRPNKLHGLPLRLPRGFIGRRTYLDQIGDYVKSNEAVLVYGQDGIGKTTLLAQASNSDAALSKPDGVVSLEGIDDEGKLLGKVDIIQRLFDSLFESNPPLKVTYPTARPYLNNTQPLVILDHLSIPMADLHNLPDLLPKGALLVANENTPSDDSFFTIRLLPLTREESIQIFGNKSGFAMEETTRPWIDKICDLLGDVPLAIAKTANYIREHGLTLREVAENLAAIQPTSQDMIQAAIERSVELVYPVLNKQEQDMLAITAVAPGNSVDRPWLESIAGGETTSRALESLELLVANSPRLRMPDGIKQILQSGRGNPHAQRELLLRHLMDELKTRSLDFKFVEDELGNILGLLQWASNEGRWPDVIALGRAVDPYLTLHGFWDAWESVLKQVLAAAQNLKDLAVRGWALHQLGTRQIGVGTKNQAINMLLRALKIRLSQGDMAGAAYTLHNLRLLLPPEPRDSPKKPVDPTEPHTLWQNILDTTRDNPWVIPGILLGVAIIILLWPPLNLNKQADPIRYNQIYQEIEYGYIVTKSGFWRLEGPITVTDNKTPVSCPPIEDIGDHDSILDWNETMTCTAHYHITDADIKNGSVTNTARARAVGSDIQSPPDSVTINFDPKYLTLVKKADAKTYTQAGDRITFTYIVRNAGQEVLKGPVTISDDKMAGRRVPCPDVQTVGNKDGALDPGEFLACTATYTITRTDMQRCSVTNTAIASAGGINSEPESVTIYCESPDGLLLTKTADRQTYRDPGEVINYTYVVTNGGSKPLKGPVTVADSVLDRPVAVSCQEVRSIGNQDENLDPDESLTCAAPYTITQPDKDNCSVTNTAIASAVGKNSEPESVTIYCELPPKLSKVADPEIYQYPGQEIAYTYVITNPGQDPLKGPVTVQDDKISVDKIHCPTVNSVGNGDDFLDPGELLACTATYSITENDMKNCSVTNTAIASAGGIPSEPESVTIHCKTGDLLLTKTANHQTYRDREPSDVIKYTYIITNPSKVPVKGPVTVQDDKIPTAKIECPELNTIGNHDDYLDQSDGEIRCTALYTINNNDIEKGSVTNIAIARAGDSISNRDSVTIYEQALRLTKKSAKTKWEDAKTYKNPGDVVLYTYDITGMSKSPLRGRVIIRDDKIQVDHIDCPAFNTTGNRDNYLDWGEKITCTATYSITQNDMDHGSVTNTATVRVGDVISKPATETLTCVGCRGEVSLTETANPTTYEEVGQNIIYTYAITNNGNVTLHPPFMISDDHIKNGTPFICGNDNQPLPPDPNLKITCIMTYTIRDDDFHAEFMPKSVTNTAIASVDSITSAPATARITCGPPTDWVPYTVQDDNSLGDIIAKWYPNFTVEEFKKKNCMGSETAISKGQVLYVPSPPPARISGHIWDTQDRIPLPNFPVILRDANRNPISYLESRGDGWYEFPNLQPGTYYIFQTEITLIPGKDYPQDFIIIPRPP